LINEAKQNKIGYVKDTADLFELPLAWAFDKRRLAVSNTGRIRKIKAKPSLASAL